MAKISKEEITFYNLDGEEIQKEMKTIEWDAEAAEKAGFEHFMMKEIHEQPRAVKDTLNSVLKDGKFDLTDIGLAEEDIRRIKPDLHCSMWFCLPCRYGGTVCDRGSGEDSCSCGAGF